MAKADKWTSVMVTKSTHAKLVELQALFNSLYLKGQLPEQNPSDRFGISLAGVIDILITRDNQHRERARKNSVPKQAKEALPEGTEASGGKDA